MESADKLERFYRCLLALESTAEPKALITDAVTLLGEATTADLAYVEIFAADPGAPAPFTTSHPAGVATSVSRAIIRGAVEERVTIEVGSTLCIPIRNERPVGVLYVQRRHESAALLDAVRNRAELFAARLALVADRIRFPSARARLTLDDEIHRLEERAVRSSLARHAGNISSAARELGTTRARMYRIINRSETHRVCREDGRVGLPSTDASSPSRTPAPASPPDPGSEQRVLARPRD